MTWVSHDGNEALLHWETQEHDTFMAPKGRVVHGGLVAFLAETAMGTATMLTCGEGEEFATIEFQIQLQRPAPIGLLSCEARGSLFDAGRTPFSSDSGLVDYRPLLAGQTSPFTVYLTYNPASEGWTVTFKEFFGGTILTRDDR